MTLILGTEEIYKFLEMIRQKLSIAILSFNLVGHPIHRIREITFKWSEM